VSLTDLDKATTIVFIYMCLVLLPETFHGEL